MFTDISYYRGRLAIPFSNKNTTDFVNTYIDPFEQEYLETVLGLKLYNEFIAGLTIETPDAKWIALRDGASFNVEIGSEIVEMKWKGLKNSTKESPLTSYVFINWLKNNYNQMTGLGVIDTTKENGSSVSVQEKMIIAYSDCVRLTGSYPFKSDEYANILFPKDIDKDLLNYSTGNLLSFLFHNKETYPSWVFRFPDIYSVNYFDL
jgi:hypothetical protein